MLAAVVFAYETCPFAAFLLCLSVGSGTLFWRKARFYHDILQAAGSIVGVPQALRMFFLFLFYSKAGCFP